MLKLCLHLALQAGKMLEAVISLATPKIMTWSQYAQAATTIVGRKVRPCVFAFV